MQARSTWHTLPGRANKGEGNYISFRCDTGHKNSEGRWELLSRKPRPLSWPVVRCFPSWLMQQVSYWWRPALYFQNAFPSSMPQQLLSFLQPSLNLTNASLSTALPIWWPAASSVWLCHCFTHIHTPEKAKKDDIFVETQVLPSASSTNTDWSREKQKEKQTYTRQLCHG